MKLTSRTTTRSETGLITVDRTSGPGGTIIQGERVRMSGGPVGYFLGMTGPIVRVEYSAEKYARAMDWLGELSMDCGCGCGNPA